MRTLACIAVIFAAGCNCSPPSSNDSGSAGGGSGGSGGGGGANAGGGGGGTACAPAVRVLLLVDESGSMCVTDPPGGQPGSTFCGMFTADGGVTTPARIRAVKRFVAGLQARPEVSVRVVPFDGDLHPAWPDAGFARPDPTLDARLDALQSELGVGTDYQRVLAEAERAIAADADAGAGPTRYVVVMITDGPPFPRCAADDMLASYADWQMPQGTWADTSDVACNQDAGFIPGFAPGGDYDQLSQLHASVARAKAAATSRAGNDYRFYALLMLNRVAVANCGFSCATIYGTYANANAGQSPSAALAIAQYTLQDLTALGGGTLTQFIDTAIPAAVTLDPIDAGAPACP